MESGGLHIIGTERHESRRIDNQLRGRAGRQGDPGSSRFYISLEDEIMRIFGGEQISRLMDALSIDENMPIEHPLITRAMGQAQIKVEGFFFDQRRNLVNYDDVMNRQREIIYKRRQRLLKEMEAQKAEKGSSQLKERLSDNFRQHFEQFLQARATEGFSEVELTAVGTELASIIPFDEASLRRIKEQVDKLSDTETRLEFLQKVFADTYTARETTLGTDVMREIERYVFLSSIDEQWMNHLDSMTHLRDSIWLRGSKEQALAEYKKEAFRLFEAMVARIELDALQKVFRIQVRPVVQTPPPQELETVGPAKTSDDLAAALSSTNSGSGGSGTKKSRTVGKKPAKPGNRKQKGSYLKKRT